MYNIQIELNNNLTDNTLSNATYHFFAPICKNYYGSYQIFIPFINASKRDFSVDRVEFMSGNSDVDSTNYKTVALDTGFRIEFTKTNDYSGCLANVTIKLS